MGAIQSAINQGITTAAVLGKLGGPTKYEQTKELKSLERKAARAEQHGDVTLRNKFEGQIQELAQSSPYKSINKYQKYVIEDTDEDIALEANQRAQNIVQTKQRQKKGYTMTSIGLIPDDIISQAKEVKPNGR